MLIIPITGKISWRNPPIVTIGLILINCFVFFVFQGDDNRRIQQARAYYFNSGLAGVEARAYLKYLGEEENIDFSGKSPGPGLIAICNRMEADKEFQDKLRSGRIVKQQDPVYSGWFKKREHYSEIMDKVVSLKYGFRPASRNPFTLFTYMFLHGGFGHLLGNMIFLWLVGCMLEMGCGRLFTAGAYVATGLFAGAFFGLVYMDSTMPLVGASGAIAGFMGAFAIMYGRARVKIFYSLGFYFNYLRFPAIALFPVWIGNEFYQLFANGHSSVAYAAHIGGLISGGALGYVRLRFFKNSTHDISDDSSEDEISPLMEKALKSIGELDMNSGRTFLIRILEKEPGNCDAIRHLFNIEKLKCAGKEFHALAGRTMECDLRNPKTHERAYETFREYVEIAKPPRLSAELYVRLGSVFANIGHTRAAERILIMIQKKKPATPGVANGLMSLARAYGSENMGDERDRILRMIREKYPQSSEAGIAGSMLMA